MLNKFKNCINDIVPDNEICVADVIYFIVLPVCTWVRKMKDKSYIYPIFTYLLPSSHFLLHFSQFLSFFFRLSSSYPTQKYHKPYSLLYLLHSLYASSILYCWKTFRVTFSLHAAKNYISGLCVCVLVYNL